MSRILTEPLEKPGGLASSWLRGTGVDTVGALHSYAKKLEPERGLFGQLGPVPHLNSVFLKEALVHLEGVLGGLGGDVVRRVVVQGFHVLEIHDAAIRVHVGDGEGDEGVLHPERTHLLIGEDEEHAPVFGEGGALHEPPGLLGDVVGDLHPHLDVSAPGGVDGHGAKFGGGRRARAGRFCSWGRGRAGVGRSAAGEEQREQKEGHYQCPHRRTNSTRLFWRPLLLWPVISISPTSLVLATCVPPSAWVSRPSISTIRITRTRSGTRLTWVRMRSGFLRASSRGNS